MIRIWFDLDRWQEIAQTMRMARLRTALTAFGVAWGMFMLVLMLGFGDGLERAVVHQFGDDATNSVWVWGNKTANPYKGHRPGRWIEFHNADVAALRARCPTIEWLSPRSQLGGYQNGAPVHRGRKTGAYQIMGDTPDMWHIRPLVLDEGRTHDALDEEKRRKVAVIGRAVRDELYEAGEPVIGTWLELRGVYFQVVGATHSPKGDEDGDRDDASISVPFSTFQQAFNQGDTVGSFAMTARADVDAEDLEAEVKDVLRARLDVDPKDEQAIGSYNSAKEFAKIVNLFVAIRWFVWFVGTATLLSGAVGVSNILLITVKERTREIGIRRALGARPRAIVGQILQEAVVLTSAAGYLGLVAAVAVLELVSAVAGDDNPIVQHPRVDFRVALAAAIALVLAGLAAGIVPATRAVRVRPVEALRAE